MNKKKKIILIVTLSCLAIILWILGYSAMKANAMRILRDKVFGGACMFIESDQNFVSQYGEISDIELHGEIIDMKNGGDCKIPCLVSVSDGKKYLVWIYYECGDSSVKCKYISIEDITGNT